MTLERAKIVFGLSMLVLLAVMLAILIASSIAGDSIANSMPYIIQTGPDKPNYYCMRLDAEKRIAYDCVAGGSVSSGHYAEYHLSAIDSYVVRGSK